MEPPITDHSKCKEFVIPYGRWLLRVELQEDFLACEQALRLGEK